MVIFDKKVKTKSDQNTNCIVLKKLLRDMQIPTSKKIILAPPPLPKSWLRPCITTIMKKATLPS